MTFTVTTADTHGLNVGDRIVIHYSPAKIPAAKLIAAFVRAQQAPPSEYARLYRDAVKMYRLSLPSGADRSLYVVEITDVSITHSTSPPTTWQRWRARVRSFFHNLGAGVDLAGSTTSDIGATGIKTSRMRFFG